MKSMRNLKLVMNVGFMALALCVAASQGKAQGTVRYMGKFALPVEARWGTAILAPGDYTISLELEAARTINYLVVRGEGKSAFILANVTDKKEITNHSQLTLVPAGAGYAVRTLDAGEAGLTLSYPVPKNKRDQEAQELHSQLRLAVSAVGI